MIRAFVGASVLIGMRVWNAIDKAGQDILERQKFGTTAPVLAAVPSNTVSVLLVTSTTASTLAGQQLAHICSWVMTVIFVYIFQLYATIETCQ